MAALARSDAAGTTIAAHHHPRDQLVYAIHGVMSIEAAGCLWTIPSSHAIWMPAGVTHRIRMETAVEMRTLYFQRGVVQGFGADCCVLAVTPLLRELVLRAMDLPPRYDPRGPDGRLMQLIVDEVGTLQRRPLSLRWPAERRLARLCELMVERLAEPTTIKELGALVGLSERSVTRLFPQHTGMSAHRWRQQARLMRAFALSEQGHNVTRIALELGYGSPSAFSKMLGKQLGGSARRVLIDRRARPG